MQYLKSSRVISAHGSSAADPPQPSLYAVLVEKEQEIMLLHGAAACREQCLNALRARLNTREQELRAQLLALQSGGAWRLVQALRSWIGAVSVEKMRHANQLVDVEGQSKQQAAQWLVNALDAGTPGTKP